MSQLELTNVINISVSEAQQGAGEYNTSNVALFTEEVAADSFGDDGYKIYLSPDEVGTDFGTDSKCYEMANALFSQNPNILANNGYLVIVPFVNAVQHFAFSGVAASGAFTIIFTEGTTASIAWNDLAATIQTKVRAVAGLENAVVTGSIATSLNISFAGHYGAQALPTFGGAGLMTSVPGAITITPTTTTVGEDLNAAIARSKGLVQYFGLMGTLIFSQTDMLAAAATVQALNKMALFISRTEADVEPDGLLDLLTQNAYSHSRGLYYGNGALIDTLTMMASYAGRGFSTNFDGSNTTQTMHLKDLIGVTADSTVDQTILDKCQAAGVDVYVSLQGIAKVFTSGANKFFDQAYNLGWFIGALQIAGFNVLATTSTKVPQTESGVGLLKGGYRQVCEQGVTNQYMAPGAWTNPSTFGNQADFFANISQRGYYIYSAPISQQSQAARAARTAPLIQIAIKEAGAEQKSNVIVNVNA